MARTDDAVRELVCACGLGDLGSVRTILRRTPNAARDWRPIIEASYKGFAPIVEILIKHGANVNALSSTRPAPAGQEGRTERHQEISRSIRLARRGGRSITNKRFFVGV